MLHELREDDSAMGYWIVKCSECGVERKLLVAFPLNKEFKKLYHYCPNCGRNTFHEILRYVEE
ncbi:MAG: hypothetical protein OWQ48_06040 [Desulfurococcus sp.]|nr:hypothetical protein [Desulfurococcus sp.]